MFLGSLTQCGLRDDKFPVLTNFRIEVNPDRGTKIKRGLYDSPTPQQSDVAIVRQSTVRRCYIPTGLNSDVLIVRQSAVRRCNSLGLGLELDIGLGIGLGLDIVGLLTCRILQRRTIATPHQAIFLGLLRHRATFVGLLSRRTIATPYQAIFVGLLRHRAIFVGLLTRQTIATPCQAIFVGY